MARDDPSKRPRKDIRDDGSQVPLEHASARGSTPRNSGNFTRGSQLLNTQVLMWIQGAKLPVYLWTGLFFVAYCIILSVTLNENNVQLICMRILAGLWDWVSLDNLKQVNLRMPDNTAHRTIMGYVPYVPEVALAWSKALRGIAGAAMIATFAMFPLTIWYVDFSARRGKAIVQERHERGAMLVDRDLLFREIAQHNQIEFVKDAASRIPELKPEAVLKLPFATRKARGIHHPYTIAGIPYPHRLEQSHTMLIGTTGSGKTTVLRKHIEQMRVRQDSAVVFDLTGAYVEAFYDPRRDHILNPMDARCPAWSIFNECRTYSEFTSAAAALIPSDGGSSEQFWVLAARTLFIEMCMKLIELGETSNQALADNLMTADLTKVHAHLKDTIADPLTAPEAARMAESIRAVFNTNAQVLRFLSDEGESFSIKEWMTREKLPGSILFITSNYVDLEMNRALLTLWSNLAIHALMTMPHSRSLRTWFMFDELGALHRLPAIESGLQTARNFGGAMILGLHSFDKLIQVYGPENARNLSSLARTKLILAAADLDTAEQCSSYIGNREIRQMDEGYSYGYNNTRDASTLTPRKQIEPLVIPDDITNLPSMHGFVKFPDGFPAARIRLEWHDYPAQAPGFIKRNPPKAGEQDGKRGGSGKPGDKRAAGREMSVERKDEALERSDLVPETPAVGATPPVALRQDRAANELATNAALSRVDPAAPIPAGTASRSDAEEARHDLSLDVKPSAEPALAKSGHSAKAALAKPGQSARPALAKVALARAEDLSIVEARDGFGIADDDGMGM